MAGRRPSSGVPYVSAFTDRHGRTRWRFRRRGQTFPMPAPTDPAFADAYADAMAGTEPQQAVLPAASVAAIVASYRASPEYRVLADETKRTYDRLLFELVDQFGAQLITGMEPRHVRAIVRRKQTTPRTANRLLSLLRIVLDHACECDIIDENPAREVKRLRYAARGYPAWTDDDIAQFEATHGPGSRARLAMRLALFTGQRRGDLCGMGWQLVRNGWITVRQSKTKAMLDIPIAPQLAEELGRLPRDQMLFLQTEYGRAFTPAGFGGWFADRVKEAGLKNRSAHGLRKSCASRLAELGCSGPMIQSITGHKTLAEVTRYTVAADQRQLAAQAAEAMKRFQLANPGSKG